jgi:2-amino-4-hydroxy-6-hydroxymethyldihydropteridine diphosphokinase / dihydropteroate synthase
MMDSQLTTFFLLLSSQGSRRLRGLRYLLAAVRAQQAIDLLQISPLYGAQISAAQCDLFVVLRVTSALENTALQALCQQISFAYPLQNDVPPLLSVLISQQLGQNTWLYLQPLAQMIYCIPALKACLPEDAWPVWPELTVATSEVLLRQYRLKKLPQTVQGTQLVGILNVTTNSFSDGGLYQDAEAALACCQRLLAAGAHCIDIGGESTRPGSELIDHQQEWQHLQPILTLLQQYWQTGDVYCLPDVSIDTRHAAIVEKALSFAIDWVNDVDGYAVRDIAHLIAATPIKYVAMHHLGIPPQKKYIPFSGVAIDYLCTWLAEKKQQLLDLNFSEQQLIFDPGIGFGNTPAQVRNIMQQAKQLQQQRAAVLIGHSRKSFMTDFTDIVYAERDVETAYLSTILAQQGIDYLRVHNVEMTMRSLVVANWFYQQE